MQPIPADAPRFCMDTWEASAAAGDQTQSVAGAEPHIRLTFDQAVAACARTPVYGSDGQLFGYKRLALASEWEDAADGQIGPGGLPYPYGSTWQVGVCNVLDSGNHPLKTGSFPGCVSSFGVMDLLGNAWEWTDSGVRIDVAAWFAWIHQQGLTLQPQVDHTLKLSGSFVRPPALIMNAISPNALVVAKDGTLGLAAATYQASMFPGGFLSLAGNNGLISSSSHLLPIMVVKGTGELPWVIKLKIEDDGAAIPDKRGCANYVGDAGSCRNDVRCRNHPHDFEGTIAARCVSDPIPKR
jgi:hypothetical protein